ncbi:MAG: prenyltransferase/squalene oxidase repeat-containing protein, partial [Planctomycetota bacterium]
MALLGISMLLRTISTRFVERSVQFGFLFSVGVHLLVLLLAGSMMIFAEYYPTAFSGIRADRSPVRKTVPDYLFRQSTQTDTQPDWSKPTEVDTSSPDIPKETRQLPPMEQSAPEMEMPVPPDMPKPDMQKSTIKRQDANPRMPALANDPSRLARREIETEMPRAPSEIETPRAMIQERPSEAIPEQAVSLSRQSITRVNSTDITAAAPSFAPTATKAEIRRSESTSLPVVGIASLDPLRPSTRSQPAEMVPAGAAPSAPTVAIASESPNAQRILSNLPMPATNQRTSQTNGATLEAASPDMMGPAMTDLASLQPSAVRSEIAADNGGVPMIDAGAALEAPGKSDIGDLSQLFGGGAPVPIDGSVANAADSAMSRDSVAGLEAIADVSELASLKRTTSAASDSPLGDTLMTPMTLNVAADLGPVGLDVDLAPRAGLTSQEEPRIAALDLGRETRDRIITGGDLPIAGQIVKSVESFQRRMARTEGGGAPIPAGLIGPETEEAIERGLQYLAGRQNQDGSWSLQGHGEPVILRSDTAATGLCLLSFQGAGYTHKQHQYANVVAKGIQWMVDNQREDGFLYVSENKLSDANVGLYSHGIAALALCEAYGMTQDPELMDPAQRALDFIEKSQHPKRGGWRYTPGISADTSVSGWMMMACKSGDLAGLRVSERTYDGMKLWLSKAQQSAGRPDRYRYNPNAPNTPSQKHGLVATKAMTSVGILMRMYLGWRRDNPNMQSAADFLAEAPPQNGTNSRYRVAVDLW